MESIISAAIKFRKVTFFSVFLLTIIGLYCYNVLPRQEAPEITPPVAIITTVYPGASPSEVEKLVTSKIEEQLTEIEGYDYCYSSSKNSVSIIVLQLANGTDTNKAWDELRKKMDDLQPKLPTGCKKIETNTTLAETAGIIISMSGEKYSYEELTYYAESFMSELRKVDGLTKFELFGDINKEVSIEVDVAKLLFHKLSLEEVITMITAGNADIPPGKLDDGSSKINVNISPGFMSIGEIEDIIVDGSGSSGHTVRLKDVAKVRYKEEDSSVRFKQNDRNAVLLAGYFKKNINVVTTGKIVKSRIAELKKQLPEDLIFDEVIFQPKDVSDSVDSFVINLLEGVALVIIVVLVGMGFRNAVIVSTAIPLSILATFITMIASGINIHKISITALIIALGMLVDNTIVVSDAIQERIDKGEEKLKACVSGTLEVSLPVLSSTLTTVGAFLPLLLLKSLAGEYISSIPKIVMVSLMASYFVSILVTPVMAYMFFKKTAAVKQEFRVRSVFNGMLQYCMQHRALTIILAAVWFLGSTGLVALTGLQFFPKENKNIIHIDITTERSSDINATERLAAEIAALLKKEPEIISYTTAIGEGIPKFFDAMPIYTQSQDFAQFLVRLDLDKGKRFKRNTLFVDHLQSILDKNISGGTIKVKELEAGEPTGAPVKLRISGKNVDTLVDYAEKAKGFLKETEGTTRVTDDFLTREYEYEVIVDTKSAAMHGLTRYDIQKETGIALNGRVASIMKKGGKEYDIIVRGDIQSKEQLENLPVKSRVSNNKILLKQVAEIKLSSQLPLIRRYDREMCITVSSDIKAGYSSVEIQNKLSQKLMEWESEGIRFSFDGEREKIKKNFGDMGSLSIFAVLIVYLILLIQFNSFRQPLVILLTIPLSSAGAFLGLFVFRQPVSFTAILGILSLFGIVVNNAIVLIDYINEERRKGGALMEACRTAVEKRFRPITLSTTTTVIGLVPLVFSNSDLFRPLAITLMCGLMFSTLLTLIIVPVVYSLVEKDKGDTGSSTSFNMKSEFQV